MKLTLRLRFHSRFGQELFITGDHALFGGGEPARARPMAWRDPETWEASLELPPDAAVDAPLVYNYLLRDTDGAVVVDWGRDRVLDPAAFQTGEVLVIDAWNDPAFYENTFYTEPFQQVLLRLEDGAETADAPSAAPSPAPQRTHTFRVKAPLLTKGQTLCLLGNGSALGQWNTTQPLLLQRRPGEDFFSVQLDLSRDSFPLAYKYGVYDLEQRYFLRYEDGANRSLDDVFAAGKHTVINDGFAVLPSTTWKGAGVAIPVFSLRSETSFGVGEFADLKLLVDWVRRVGLKVVQILPVNDTTATHTWTDSYPYAAISAFALNPVYLNLAAVATRHNQKRLEKLEPERQRLNALEVVDYAAVMKAKLAFLREIYPSQKGEMFQSGRYQKFFDRNRHWLTPYAVFCHLRDQYGTPDFNQWPAYSRCQPAELAALAGKGSEAYDEIAFHYFIQYHLHLQLEDASDYAHTNGVILKGDIPIGVYRYGVDAWEQPELYHLEMQAGAPPDAFAEKGQNWGFPTYNWPRMKETGFAWWKQRFEQMSRYFDAFRIDHILGFFRIWSIPMHAVEGILGYFVPALPVHLDEFQNRGISFDRNRFLKPYITDAVLAGVFGAESETVKARFLDSGGADAYSLKPEFATQRQIEQYFGGADLDAQSQRLKQSLFDLVSNVILFEVEGSGGRQFHFRFAIDKTASFQQLEPHVRAQLIALYIDYFFRRQDDFWMREAWQTLPALKRVTNMLVCGEDLGLVPGCVPEVMRRLGLLSLEIQRMPKQPQQQFFRPKDAPYLSVVTPSTHDMSTIRGWWEEDRQLTQRFFNSELGVPGEAPAQCEPWINRAILLQHLASPAMWSIFQLQDLLGMDADLRRANPNDERINVPANPKHYWQYRMHLTLEDLLRAEEFNRALKQIVAQNGR